MEAKQTAVEWLEDKIINYDLNQGMSQMRKYILQAKQMERQQICDAFVNGEHQQGFENESEQYYNETYGK